MSATTTNTTINLNDLVAVKGYVHQGKRYGTAANLRKLGLEPTETATEVQVTGMSRLGEEISFTVYDETETRVFDVQAAAKKRELLKELKLQQNDIFKALRKGDISGAQYDEAKAELTKAIAELS